MSMSNRLRSLIDASVEFQQPKISGGARTLPKNVPADALGFAERINQNLFFQRRQKEEGTKREKLLTQVEKHYTLAVRYIESQGYANAYLRNFIKRVASVLMIKGLSKIVDNLFQKLNTLNMLTLRKPNCRRNRFADSESYQMVRCTGPSGTWFEHQKLVPEETTDITPIQPQCQSSG